MEKVSESEMQKRREIWKNASLTKLINEDELLSDNFIYNKPSRKHNDISIRESINKDIFETDTLKDSLKFEVEKSIQTTIVNNQRVILNLDDDLPF